MATTPKELGTRLGVDPRVIRKYLRGRYRPNGEDKNSRWLLDDAMVAAVVAKFGR